MWVKYGAQISDYTSKQTTAHLSFSLSPLIASVDTAVADVDGGVVT